MKPQFLLTSVFLFSCLIGTSQNSPFSVNNTSGQSVTSLTSNVGYGALLRFQRFGNTSNYYAFETGANSLDDLRLHVNNNWSSPIMSFKTDGTVGIGTATPGAQLDIKSSGGAFLNFTTGRTFSSSRNWGFGTNWIAEGDFAVLQSTTNANSPSVNRFSIDPNGQVGIGNPTPGAQLDIKSSVAFLNFTTTRGFGTSRNWGFVTSWSSEGDFAILQSSTNTNSPSVNRLAIDPSGKVGIGAGIPLSTLHLNSQSGQTVMRFTSGNTNGSAVLLERMSQANVFYALETGAGNNDDFRIHNGNWNTPIMSFKPDGKVGIGNGSPDAMLAVSGQVHAQEVKVSVAVPGPDYVFEKEYKLASLEEIKNYIAQNKHLPEVPSAKEMEKNGIQLGEMNLLLLKKIEELTLHAIDLSKKIDELSKKNENLEAQNKDIQFLREEIKSLREYVKKK